MEQNVQIFIYTLNYMYILFIGVHNVYHVVSVINEVINHYSIITII